MDYLNENQARIALSAIANIKDKLHAVEVEVTTRQKPYKSYLNEKLGSINWDVQVLLNLAKPDKSINVDKDTKLILENMLDDIDMKCKANKVWDEDLFPSSDWNDLWNLTERVINTSKIDEHQLDILTNIDNILCGKENDGLIPIDPDLHSRFIDILNYISKEMSY